MSRRGIAQSNMPRARCRYDRHVRLAERQHGVVHLASLRHRVRGACPTLPRIGLHAFAVAKEVVKRVDAFDDSLGRKYKAKGSVWNMMANPVDNLVRVIQ